MDLVYVSNANLLLFADATQRLVNSLDVQPRSFVRYPFDLIGVEAISKAFALIRAASLLISNGYHDEALGLMRTLIELAMNLRYLTAERESLGQRATTFLRFAQTDKNLWSYWLRETHSDGTDWARLKIKAEKMGHTPDGISAHRHWSGIDQFVRKISEIDHPLDKPEHTLFVKKLQRTTDYYRAGCYVHASQPGLDNYADIHAEKLSPKPAGARYGGVIESVLVIGFTYLPAVINYVLFGMNVHLPPDFDPKRLQWHELARLTEQYKQEVLSL